MFSGSLAIRGAVFTPMHMTSPPIKLIADSYKVSRQRLFQLRKIHGFSVQDFREPDTVFSKLLENGKANSLRSRLASPTTREEIKNTLAQF